MVRKVIFDQTVTSNSPWLLGSEQQESCFLSLTISMQAFTSGSPVSPGQWPGSLKLPACLSRGPALDATHPATPPEHPRDRRASLAPRISPGCGASWAGLGHLVRKLPGRPAQELRQGAFQSHAKKTGTFLALLPLWCRMTGFDRTVRFSIWVLQLGFIVLSKVGNGTHIMGCRPQTPSPA